MFATVECKDAPNGLRGFVRDIFTLPEIELRKVKIPSGEWFYRVIVTEYRGQIPVEETVERVKRLKKGVIFEVNFPCDERTQALEFEPSELPAQLLFNSAVNYIKELKPEPLESSLTVFDPSGFYCKKLHLLVPFFARIKVYTNEVTLYGVTAERLMADYGLSLALCDRFTGSVPDSTVIICPDEVPFCNFYKGILFTNAEENPPCGACFRGSGVDLPGEYELLRPEGIGKMHFAAALYEKGGVRSLGELSFRKLRLT